MATVTVAPTEVVAAAGLATQLPTDRVTAVTAIPSAEPVEPTSVPPTLEVLVISATVDLVAIDPPPPATLPVALAVEPVPATAAPPVATAVPPVQVVPPPSADVASAEQYCIDLINVQRAAAGLPPYARDETVMGIARARVADMVARGYRGHNDPVTGASLARDMLIGAGFRLAGENWYGHRAGPVEIADAAMAWFMTDPPHAQGILSSGFNLVGVGIAYNGQQWLLIQNFAAR